MALSPCNWEKLIISQKSSKSVKEKLVELNKTTNFEGKYIGVLPIYWGTLDIFNKNNKNNNNNNNNNIKKNESTKIQIINTTKDKLLVNREFYYLKNNDNHFPVFNYSDHLVFSLREIKKQISSYLIKEGFNANEFDLFRIYKMNGFHLFAVILPTSNSMNNLQNNWVCDKGIELLHIVNQEIVNPFMKVSQNQSNNHWSLQMSGLFEKEIIPYYIKWNEIIATLANIIDSEPDDNINYYFQPFITNDVSTNLFHTKIKESN
jgi:hypothetical protein